MKEEDEGIMPEKFFVSPSLATSRFLFHLFLLSCRCFPSSSSSSSSSFSFDNDFLVDHFMWLLASALCIRPRRTLLLPLFMNEKQSHVQISSTAPPLPPSLPPSLLSTTKKHPQSEKGPRKAPPLPPSLPPPRSRNLGGH